MSCRAVNCVRFYTLVGLGLSQFADHLSKDINNSRCVKATKQTVPEKNMNIMTVCTILLLELIWTSKTKNMYPSVRKQHSIYKGCIKVSVPFWLDLAASIDRLHFLRVRKMANKVSVKVSLPLLLVTWLRRKYQSKYSSVAFFDLQRDWKA